MVGGSEFHGDGPWLHESVTKYICLLQGVTDGNVPMANLHIVFLFFAGVMFSISLLSLFGYHCFLVSRNRSTLGMICILLSSSVCCSADLEFPEADFSCGPGTPWAQLWWASCRNYDSFFVIIIILLFFIDKWKGTLTSPLGMSEYSHTQIAPSCKTDAEMLREWLDASLVHSYTEPTVCVLTP